MCYEISFRNSRLGINDMFAGLYWHKFSQGVDHVFTPRPEATSV